MNNTPEIIAELLSEDISENNGFILEGLHGTFWENENGERVTLLELLEEIKSIPEEEMSVDELKPHLLSWNNDPKEIAKIEKADLKYPIVILTNETGRFVSILDGHHRAQKAARHNMKVLKCKKIRPSDLSDKMRKIFKH